MPCPICFEEVEEDGPSASAGTVKNTTGTTTSTTTIMTTMLCGHSACRTCLQTWFCNEETTGQKAATCPIETCRRPVLPSEAWVILGGRFFTPAGSGGGGGGGGRPGSSLSSSNKKRPFHNNVGDDDERPSKEPRAEDDKDKTVVVDDDDDDKEEESTRQWLEENTMVCGGCDGRIMKASGCDKLQCLCGYRVCWKCRAVGAECMCNPGHGFVDNVTGRSSWAPKIKVATKEELQDMKTFLEQQRRQQPRVVSLFGSDDDFSASAALDRLVASNYYQVPFTFRPSIPESMQRLRVEAFLAHQQEQQRRLHALAAGFVPTRTTTTTTTTTSIPPTFINSPTVARPMMFTTTFVPAARAPPFAVAAHPPPPSLIGHQADQQFSLRRNTTSTTTSSAMQEQWRKSRIIQYIIRDELSLAIEMYEKEMNDRGGVAPIWAGELAFYLKRHDKDTVQALFPGVMTTSTTTA